MPKAHGQCTKGDCGKFDNVNTALSDTKVRMEQIMQQESLAKQKRLLGMHAYKVMRRV
jgi:hypothetical protein